jgi:hypothetical protein
MHTQSLRTTDAPGVPALACTLLALAAAAAAAAPMALGAQRSVPEAMAVSNGSIGVFGDPLGGSTCATVDNSATLYVIAATGGASADGITTAEFRIEVTNPANWIFIFNHALGFSSTVGDPIDLLPGDASNAAGTRMTYGFSCLDPQLGPDRILLGTIVAINLGGGPTELLVRRSHQPGSPGPACPSFTPCTGPAVCLATCCTDLDPVLSRFALNDPETPCDAAPTGCFDLPCATLETLAPPSMAAGASGNLTIWVGNCSPWTEQIDVFVGTELVASQLVSPSAFSVDYPLEMPADCPPGGSIELQVTARATLGSSPDQAEIVSNVSVACTPPVQPAGEVGIFADAAGTQPCTSLAANSFTTLYVLARTEGAAAAGIVGADFRIEVTDPSGYQFFWQADPGVTLATGNPLDLTPLDPFDAAGVELDFGTCQDPVLGPDVIALGTIGVLNLAGGPTDLVVKQRTPLFEHPCASFALCDAPPTSVCMAECCDYDAALFRFGLNRASCDGSGAVACADPCDAPGVSGAGAEVKVVAPAEACPGDPVPLAIGLQRHSQSVYDVGASVAVDGSTIFSSPGFGEVLLSANPIMPPCGPDGFHRFMVAVHSALASVPARPQDVELEVAVCCATTMCTPVPVQVSDVSLEQEGPFVVVAWTLGGPLPGSIRILRAAAGGAPQLVAAPPPRIGRQIFRDEAPLVPGRQYAYWLEAVDRDGTSQRLGPWEIAIAPIGGPHFLSSGPNPVVGAASFRYYLPGPGRVEVEVFDSLGRRVRRFAAGGGGAGIQEAVWDRRDESGAYVASGVYHYRVRGGGLHATGKFVVVR